MKEVVLLGAYTNTIEKESVLIKTILDWKKHNIPIILSTHYPVSEKIQNLVDYYVFDREQHMEQKLINYRVDRCDSFEIVAPYNKPYHAAAALIAFQNAIKMIGNKFDFFYLQDYDANLNKQELLNIIRPLQSSHYEMFAFNWKNDPNSYAATICFFKQGAFNKIWGDIQSVDDYLDLVRFANKNNQFAEAIFKDITDKKKLQETIYLFNKEQTASIINSFSEHTADDNTTEIYVATTSTDAAILFLVNDTNDVKNFEIQTIDLVTRQKRTNIQPLHGNIGMYWQLFNNVYLKVTCGEIKKEYLIISNTEFNECRFKFLDNTQIFMKS